MELHVPEGPIESVKDFLKHIIIVTIGILIALGLEQLVDAHRHARLARDAVESFRRELADNLVQLNEVMAHMPQMRDEIEVEIANLESASPRKIHYPGINFNLISTASWDTAIATHALNELPYDEVHHYAEAYGTFRLFEDIERKGLADWQEMRNYSTDASKLTPEQRRTLIEKLYFYENMTYVIDVIGKGVSDEVGKALSQK